MNILTVTLLALVIGYVVGLLQNGIHIYNGEKPKAVKPTEEKAYNSHSAVPPEIEQYLNQTYGQIK